jgi:hypothetical protein
MTYGFFDGQPDYDSIRQKIIEIANGVSPSAQLRAAARSNELRSRFSANPLGSGSLSSRLLHGLRRMTPINLVHDLLCPTDCICDGGYGRGHPRSAVVLRELPCRKDACGDEQDALATFV